MKVKYRITFSPKKNYLNFSNICNPDFVLNPKTNNQQPTTNNQQPTTNNHMNLPAKFWIVTFITFINSVCFTILIPTLYPYAKQLGLSDFQASLLTTAFAISQFIATPILGRLSDFLGRRPLLIISLFGTVLANLLASVSSTALPYSSFWLAY